MQRFPRNLSLQTDGRRMPAPWQLLCCVNTSRAKMKEFCRFGQVDFNPIVALHVYLLMHFIYTCVLTPKLHAMNENNLAIVIWGTSCWHWYLLVLCCPIMLAYARTFNCVPLAACVLKAITVQGLQIPPGNCCIWKVGYNFVFVWHLWPDYIFFQSTQKMRGNNSTM